MKLKRFKSTFILFILCFIIFNIYLSFSIVKASSEKDKIVRLHVVSNSNTLDDQLIKLKISSKVEDFISSLQLENEKSTDILKILNQNSQEIIKIVNNELKKENVPYSSTINIGKIYYDESKENSIISMDKGLYNSIKITLGKGEGKNFWNFIAPNKENLEKLKNYENILPGINKLYKNFEIFEENENLEYESTYQAPIYNSKILEFLNTLL